MYLKDVEIADRESRSKGSLSQKIGKKVRQGCCRWREIRAKRGFWFWDAYYKRGDTSRMLKVEG